MDDTDNPIAVGVGESQIGVDPNLLRPFRSDLLRSRLDLQIQLQTTGISRFTPIKVNLEGVIVDGHHAVRVAAELGQSVDVLVVEVDVAPSGMRILELPIQER